MARVLVVEDDLACQKLIVHALREHDVHTVNNGRAALDWLETNPPPDVILLDVTLPVMSGPEFRAHQLSSPLFAHIPVIWVSATTHFVERLREAVRDRVIEKPFSIAHLGEVVRSQTQKAAVSRRPSPIVLMDSIPPAA